jgi:hypothetical protein
VPSARSGWTASSIRQEGFTVGTTGLTLADEFAERLIGSIRRECLEHIIVSGEAHLRRDSNFLCRLLQLRQNASVVAQGRADLSPRFNRPESFVHTRSSAGFTIITSGFEFSV